MAFRYNSYEIRMSNGGQAHVKEGNVVYVDVETGCIQLNSSA